MSTDEQKAAAAAAAARDLRAGEDEICRQQAGDIFTIMRVFRYFCWRLHRGDRDVKYNALPGRLRRLFGAQQYLELRASIDAYRGVEPKLSKPTTKRCAACRDVTGERLCDACMRRRVQAYQRQWSAIERRYGGAVDQRQARGPMARPVRIVGKEAMGVAGRFGLPLKFHSARQAAREIGDAMGVIIRRSDIRIAVAKGIRCHRLRFEYYGVPQYISRVTRQPVGGGGMDLGLFNDDSGLVVSHPPRRVRRTSVRALNAQAATMFEAVAA